MKETLYWWGVALGILASVVAIIVILTMICIGIQRTHECRADDENRIALINHNATCNGRCHFTNAYRSYGESVRYTYACDKCGAVFLFYDQITATTALYSKGD